MRGDDPLDDLGNQRGKTLVKSLIAAIKQAVLLDDPGSIVGVKGAQDDLVHDAQQTPKALAKQERKE
jgi:hypothetical protein